MQVCAITGRVPTSAAKAALSGPLYCTAKAVPFQLVPSTRGFWDKAEACAITGRVPTSAAKAASSGPLYGTAKAVPFQIAMTCAVYV